MGRLGDFGRFAWANGITQTGTQVTVVALPLAALLTLDAGAFQLGLLSAAQMLAFLLIGLPAGVWVDRSRRRPILIWSDVVRGVALLSVPVAAWLDILTLPHLYAVALVLGVGTVFFDIAHMSFLPAIVPKERLERGNSVLEATRNASLLAGPGLGGWLVAALTAPIALLADAVSYLASALLLSRVRAEERPRRPGGQESRAEERPRPPGEQESRAEEPAAPRPGARRVRAEVAEGVRFVAGEPVLRRIAVCGALVMVANSISTVGLPLYLVEQLGVSSAQYGLLLSAAAVGSLVGAALVAPLTARFGTGRTLYGAAVLASVLYLPALATGPGWRLLLLPLASSLFGVASSVFGVAQLSYRQRITPARLLGRVNASMRFLMWGAFPLGGLAGGALGEWLGGYAVFAAGVTLMGLSHLAVVTFPALLKARTTVDEGTTPVS
ncbi:MFS transporter [Nonomuraea phyllanthi]|uniref:MFS transporter n=1 Tax=Nonomuraea phyllanthi TaxID=2219224 RepID=UPI001294154C|nr:MFS transporter [Nonomuraea phyllanthi]QFY12367.1 MFS transporter [Nonomuraea phyllanthi]